MPLESQRDTRDDDAGLRSLLETVDRTPGIASVAASRRFVPPGGEITSAYAKVSGPCQCQRVTHDYLRTMNIPMLKGIDFARVDPGSRAVVIDRELASRLFGSTDPVGEYIQLGTQAVAQASYRVIGTIASGHLENGSTRNDETPAPIVLILDDALSPAGTALFIRTQTDVIGLSAVRSKIRAVLPSTRMESLLPMDAVLRAQSAPMRRYAELFSSFAILALLLMMTGVFGIVSFFATRRNREIGIRLALGAPSRDIVVLLLKEAITILVVGYTLGAGGGYIASKVIATTLFARATFDLQAFALACALMLLLVLCAVCLPALRAAASDPNKALRAE